MKYAGFWIRFIAYLVDALILYVPVSVFNYIFIIDGIISFTQNSSLDSMDWSAFYRTFVLCIFLNLLVYWFFSAMFESGGWQATPGKRLMGLRVVDEMGGRISFKVATGRYFSKYLSALILFIGYIMVGLTEKKQGLHDKMAGTFVLYGKPETQGENLFQMENRSDEDTVVTSDIESGRWVLAGFDDNGHVVRLTFNESSLKANRNGLIIGRDSKLSDLHISDQSVSRQHAKLYEKHGKIWIEDLKSTNGILIGNQIVKASAVALPDQGNITIGAVQLSIGRY